ncbi:hypothetical protein BGW38_001203 [Lunasporangiospora selenospora]|uniref:Zn(2)-C6 fungal-type domain-containing protein n=1 Tax=Lunasporangiospora selenospora TaxID=979761 RepID=A0A9P6KHZ8_9FUNG|nr:hypothetical protein BGW38_001203 [Lunasporangiospora selenospora]
MRKPCQDLDSRSSLHLPGKARKRHKVATSCNRCRQNKRKCDSGVPCSNCKRNNVDCCYTDAQLSRAIWGDSPLSQEKVIGVAANRGSTAQTLAVMPPYALAHAQSKHISKSLRVAHPGPLYPPASSNAAVSASVPARAPAQLLPKDTLVKSATAPIDQASSTRPTWQQQEQLTRPVLATMQDQSAHRVSSYIDGSGMDSRGHCYPPNATSQVHYSSSHAEFHRRDSLIPNTSPSSAYPGYYGSLPFASATESLPPSSSTQRPAVATNSPSSADGSTVVGVSPPIPTSAGFVGYSHRATASTSSTTSLTSPMDLLPPIATATAQAHAAFNPSKHTQSLQLPSLQQPQVRSSQPRNGEHASHQRQLSRQSIQDSLPMQPFLADATAVVAVATAENNSNDISAMVGVTATGTGTGTTMPETSTVVASGADQCNSFESWNESAMLESPYGEGNGGAYFTGVPRTESSSTHSQIQSSSATSATVFPAPSPRSSMSTEQISGRMPTSLGQRHGQSEGQASEASSEAMAIAMDDKMARATTGREESLLESKRMQKIASEMLAVKKYDMSIMIPRHISQERDEFWIPPSSSSSSPLSPSSSTSSFSSSSPSSSLQCASGIQGLPNHLLMLPRDANYLVDVFFEHSHFYYPVINRAAVELYLMDPNSPQALLMLNIIFMTACKHLGRASDIKRAIQFRERAREVQFFIEGKVRLSRMQSLLLGSLAVYGVFNVAIGLAQVCGTYNALATTPCSTMPCSTTATASVGLASSSSAPAASACASASPSTNTSVSTSATSTSATSVPTSAPTSSSSVSALASSSASALSPSIPLSLSLSSSADLETEKVTGGGTETISTAAGTTGRIGSGQDYLQGPGPKQGLGERDQEPEQRQGQGQGQGQGRGRGRGQERRQTKDSRGRGREEEYADLESQMPSIQEGQEGVIPEAAYQARLWVFWGFYIRDSIARLYFGWPHGIDSLLVSAELPKIAGCVGLGGRRKLSSEAGAEGGPGSTVASVTGKRRDSMFHRDARLPEKRRMTSEHPDRHGPSTDSTHSDGKSISFDRVTYRNTRLVDSDDEDDDDDDMDDEDVRRRSGRNSNRRFARRRLLGTFAQDDEDDDGDDVCYRGLVDDDEPADRDRDEQDRLGHLGFRGSIGQESSMQHPHSRGNPNRNRRRLPYRFSAMSPELLEEQSQGHWRAFVPPNQTLDTTPLVSARGNSSVPRDLLSPYPHHHHHPHHHQQQQQQQQQQDSQSPQQDQQHVPLIRKESQGLEEKQQTFDRHMERMRLLLEAEEDVTDGGSYSRFLFLEEVKLWAIGRRVAFYLAGRSSNPAPSACPLAGLSGSALASAWNAENASGAEGYGEGCSNNASTSSYSGTSSRSPTWSRHVARQWSEQAWIQDQELQSLQADLIEWEKSFPEHLRFREDVDQEGVNHKVNGKMGVLIMSYYTITILLQSSYLPVPGNVTPGPSSTSSVRASPSRTLDPSARSSKRHSAEPVSQCDSPSHEAPSTAHAQDCQESPVQSPSQDPLGPGHRPWSPPLSSKPRGLSICPRYFNTAHEISSTLSNVLLHHVELMLDSYPNWCSFQAKVNHSLVAALRVSCLNAKLSHNSSYEREEAKAGFKMGSDLFKRLALLPTPLTIRDWPAEEDVQQMLDIEEEFRDMMMTQEEQVEAETEELAEEEEAGVASGTMDGSGTVPEDVGNDESWSSASMGANLPIFGDLDDEGFKFECDQPSSMS